MLPARILGIVLISATPCLAAVKVPTTATQAADGGGFLAQVREHFAAWDADHDGELSGAEIEMALDDPANQGPAGAAAATLRRSFYASKFRPITLATLTAAVNHDPSVTGEGKPKPPAYEALYAADLRHINGLKRDLFASGAPRVETLGQGRLGDCFLLAGVGTLASRQPDKLKQMVSELPDGQVAVQFGNGQRVVLPRPTDGEACIGASTLNDGLWANVFEKAIGHLLLERQKASKHVTPFDVIGVGGSPATPMAILTGHQFKRVGCEDFQKPGKLAGAEREARLEAMRSDLAAAFATGHLVVGGTADIHGGETVVRGLYYDHSYGVLGYDRASDTVTFWNPMGNAFKPKGEPGLANGYPTSHGEFKVPLPEAVMWFGSFSIETDEPVKR